jgi:hypothetical protein
MKTYGGANVQTHVVSISALDEVIGQLHASAALPPVEENLAG